MIRVGMKLPRVALRTDEGTPVALADLKGRAVAIFLVGAALTETAERLLTVLAEGARDLLLEDVSPIAVVGVGYDTLAEYRSRRSPPFLLLADPDLVLHEELRHEDGGDVDVWIADEEGLVEVMIPTLPPEELVRQAIDGAARMRRMRKSD